MDKLDYYQNRIAVLEAHNRRLERDNARLAELAITDDLTGLYNMRHFNHRLMQEFSRARRYHHFLSLVMLDLDNFKHINDTINHLAGSFVLNKVGRVIAQAVRRDDIAARFGGDEFVVMLPEATADGATALAQRLLHKIAAQCFVYHQHRIQVTASIGVSTYDPNHRTIISATQLLKLADVRMYEAKHAGRGRVSTASTL